MTQNNQAIQIATDLYLRGFNSQDIENETGITVRKLIKILAEKGIRYTQDDIVNHQINYIRTHYTQQEIESGYAHIMTYDDPDKARRGKNIKALNCAFGHYPKVMSALLGDKEYKALRTKLWKEKQQATMVERYGVENAFQKDAFDNFVSPERVALGRIKRNETMIERYGVPEPNQNPVIAAKMQQTLQETNMRRHGVAHTAQRPEIAKKIHENRQQTMLKRYGAKNSVQIPEINQKIFESRAKNNTLNASIPEDTLYQLLVERYGEDDVLRNAMIDDRYPFNVDFYIKSRDLFIELNGDRCHGDHWYDATNQDDVALVEHWKSRMSELEELSGKLSRYRKFIETWTVSDVLKRQYAIDNELNYLVFWDGSNKTVNQKRVPRLSDAYEWFDDGCPNPNDWKQENTC